MIIVALLGAAMVALQLWLRGETDPETQIVGQCVAGVIFVAALLVAWRGLRAGWIGVVLIVALAGAFRAAAFIPSDRTPPLSTDVHRYAWDGRIQLAGINPYRYEPFRGRTASLRDDVIWPGVNRKSWKTVYPPGAQASFATGQAVFGDSLRSTTWLFLLAELGTVGLLILTLRKLRAPPERVLAYAWHPLAISEIAGNGHVDAMALLGIAGLLAAWAYRIRAVAGLAVAFAALVKLGPVLLVPALARRGGRRFVIAATALGVAAYVPYAATVGSGVFGSLKQFDERERFNGSLDRLLRPLIGADGAKVLLAACLLGVVAIVAVRSHRSVEQVARSGLLILGGLLIAVDYVQPWQALWLIPFMAIVVAPGWMWLTLALPLAYTAATLGRIPLWAALTIYVPLGLVAVWRIAGRRRPSVMPGPVPTPPTIAAVIPVLNEEVALKGLLAEWPAGVVDEIIVVDGGSTDRTVAVANAAGARVVTQSERGYGRACATGAAAARDADVIVFLDGDGSCDPADITAVLAPVLAGEATLSLGARTRRERGAMSLSQRLGNRLVAEVLRVAHGARVGDVPCLRAIRTDALKHLEMREMTYGWPTEMIVRAAQERLAIAVVPVSFRRRRGGESKVSGRFGPSVQAGVRMLAVALKEA